MSYVKKFIDSVASVPEIMNNAERILRQHGGPGAQALILAIQNDRTAPSFDRQFAALMDAPEVTQEEAMEIADHTLTLLDMAHAQQLLPRLAARASGLNPDGPTGADSALTTIGAARVDGPEPTV